MTPEEFDNTPFSGNMFVMHNGEKKFVVSSDFPERLFGLLPEKPETFADEDWREVQWVRCENVTEVIRPQVIDIN